MAFALWMSFCILIALLGFVVVGATLWHHWQERRQKLAVSAGALETAITTTHLDSTAENSNPSSRKF